MATTTGNLRGKEEHASKEPLEKAKEVGAQAAHKAKEVGAQAADKAKEVGTQLADKAKETVSSVGEMASQAASTVGKKADEMTASAGADIKKWGDSMASKAPHEGVLGQASQAMAETLQEGGKYLEEAKLSGMADDLVKMIRRNPVPAVLLGVGVGFILGRAMRD
jgi:ElaB/YqjD/DUF883 family membrane-anchored ribosome-binding protein